LAQYLGHLLLEANVLGLLSTTVCRGWSSTHGMKIGIYELCSGWLKGLLGEVLVGRGCRWWVMVMVRVVLGRHWARSARTKLGIDL
jgi:hypothetical protein